MIERVHIVEDWARMGPNGNSHLVYFVGRQYPGAPTALLTPEGEWQAVQEGATSHNQPDGGWRFAEGALDALVAAYQNVAAPTPATERHLKDATAVRDRLLALVEKRGLR